MSFLSHSTSESIILCGQCKSAIPSPRLATNVLEKIRDNYIPNSSETKQIAELISEAQYDLKRTDETIADLQGVMDKLELQRQQLQSSIEMYESLRAPVRRVPTEILSEIFRRCASSDISDTMTDQEGLAPLNLGLVCRRWRDIVLSLEELWSIIFMDLDTLFHDDSTNGDDDYDTGYRVDTAKARRAVDVLGTYLERSGSHPLSIHVENLYDAQYFHVKRLYETLTPITSEMHRCRTATFHCGSHYSRLMDSIADHNVNGFIALEELTLHNWDQAATTPKAIFQECPKLRFLAISDLCGESIGAHGFPWSQLHVLKIMGEMVTLSYLRHCNSLSHLEIGTGSVHGLRADIRGSISHNLQSLSVSIPARAYHSGTHEIHKMFSALNLPLLKSFTAKVHFGLGQFHTDKHLEDRYVAALSSLLSRSTSSLQEFCLDDIMIAQNDLLSLFRLMPALTTLRLKDPHLLAKEGHLPLLTDSSLLQCLAYTPHHSEKPYLPCMTHIELTLNSSMNDQILLDMIESRWCPTVGSRGVAVACLESVTLAHTNHHLLSPASRLRLDRLIGEGLKVIKLD